ncbi:TetR/AcrR family transcriptional regulator [Vibrio fluvialis]|uniref:TetR/AcrR family transcriptional regulator n=1 Tax=Vibrio fluvialis TaxID=676 RepID=UPI002ACAE6FA|nr:TetR/AcrR family transcriptional regulator [Vibrio fluvialis]MDZ5513314.1 TetR/AcrR family transcriptional regulator [Vibrio fluvialis]
MARKCNFDRDEKLTQAMELFWQRGYANTAISDLVDTLQINRFSLYNTFGDKQNLYYEALDKYLNTVSLPGLSALREDGASLSAIETFLNQFAALQRKRSGGCFIQNALVEHAGSDEKVLDKGQALFDQLLELLSHAIHNAQQEKQISMAVSPHALAQLILTQMQGMRVLGKAKRFDDLDQAVNALLQLLKCH